MTTIQIESAACTLDGCGNDYSIVIRETGTTGPWLITSLAARRLPHSGRVVRYDSTEDDAREELDRMVTMAATDGGRYTYDERHAIAMAFPSLRSALPGWERGGLSLYRCHADGGPRDICTIQRLARHGRTRPLGPSLDTPLRRYAEVDAALRALRAQITPLQRAACTPRVGLLPEEQAAIDGGAAHWSDYAGGGIVWDAGPSHPLRVAAITAQRQDSDARWDAAFESVAASHSDLVGRYTALSVEAQVLASQID